MHQTTQRLARAASGCVAPILRSICSARAQGDSNPWGLTVVRHNGYRGRAAPHTHEHAATIRREGRLAGNDGLILNCRRWSAGHVCARAPGVATARRSAAPQRLLRRASLSDRGHRCRKTARQVAIVEQCPNPLHGERECSRLKRAQIASLAVYRSCDTFDLLLRCYAPQCARSLRTASFKKLARSSACAQSAWPLSTEQQHSCARPLCAAHWMCSQRTSLPRCAYTGSASSLAGLSQA